MSGEQRLRVVICWHMHQPQYANRIKGTYQLPWTYLHAIKDYVDMAAHLENAPAAKAVVNFAPILLEQLDDYAQQIRHFFDSGREITDPLLNALGSAVLPADIDNRLALVKNCLRANRTRLIERFPYFLRLTDMAEWFLEHRDSSIYINDQYLVDLLIWYHLAWLGETVRRSDSRVKGLMKKAGAFTYRDRHLLLEIIGELLSGVIERYRVLAQRGQIELSVTPYAHPIVPLLLDFQSAREAMPDIVLPALDQYPGGEARVQWQIKHGLETFEHFFGFRPSGCWPSEGSVSDAAIRAFENAGFRWVATGENVLRHSLKHHAIDDRDEGHRAYALQDSRLACFFRDDGLSDLVGFTYATWHADDAVNNLLSNLENIAQHTAHRRDDMVVSIILDGENAWEHYPENGYYFLSGLYQKLSQHPDIELTTFSECLDDGISLRYMPHIVAGSWVYGSFSTWIGDADKNRAWDMLGDAKRCFDHALQAAGLSADQRAAAEKQLAICEGSDWFWWFGDYNPADTVSDFDHLYRMQLVNLYQILGEPPPEYLSHTFAHGSGIPQLGGVMRRGSA